MTLHVAPCERTGDFVWPKTLHANWIVLERDHVVGFDCLDDESVASLLLQSKQLWDADALTWTPAYLSTVRQRVNRSQLALVAASPELLEISGRQKIWLDWQKLAALQRRYGREPGEPPAHTYSKLLSTNSQLDASELIAFKKEAGDFQIWRTGDLSYGLHLVTVNSVDDLSRVVDEPIKHHVSSRSIPMY